jgi:hypothetical protein
MVVGWNALVRNQRRGSLGAEASKNARFVQVQAEAAGTVYAGAPTGRLCLICPVARV